MPKELNRLVSSGAGLGLAVFLSFLLLAGFVALVAREVWILLPGDRITASLRVSDIIGSKLGWQLAAFVVATVFCHVLVGLIAFTLARLTELAFPVRAIGHRRWLIFGWFVVLAGLVIAANTTWYPASYFAGESSWWRGEVFGVRPVMILAPGVALVIVFIAWRGLQRVRWRSQITVAAIAGVTLLVLYAASELPKLRSVAVPAVGVPPHVVIIGIDALRHDLSVPRHGPAKTPHIAAFLSGARQFTDTTSPLPRTFGAWVSILTGRHPVASNARVNLMPRRLVHEGETLPDALRARGYHAIYSTDEVRFANIDESYGFDQLVTPPIGAVDFLLGYAGDLPLVNLVASSRLGRTLFPSNHANRAAQVTYEPGDFVERLEDEIQVDSPTLLAIHLTLTHWPYSWAGMSTPSTPQEYRPAYGRAVEAVDLQFDAVMRLLADKGVLDNAIVVLLSDHGEALGGETDSMLRKTGTSREVWDSLWGHGTSVMSPHQYRVLLAMRPYGRARLPGLPGKYDWPVSLEDLRPTIEHCVTGRAPDGVDGISLLPYLSGNRQASSLATRVRFTETDFNTPSTLAGHYEASRLVDEAAIFYELDRESGWVQFREDRLSEILARKQRAAISPTLILAAIPGPPGTDPKYLLTDRLNPSPRVLEGVPNPATDPEAYGLWTAALARFPGEWQPSPEPPRM
jgi:hypothetical protein